MIAFLALFIITNDHSPSAKTNGLKVKSTVHV